MEKDKGNAVVASTAFSEEEPEILDEVAYTDPNDKTGFKLTLEPPMVFSSMALTISMMIQTNLFEERMCLHTTFGQNETVDCFNMTAAEQEIIQPAVADLLMIMRLIDTLVPSIMGLFLGPWSDVNGRLPLMLSSIAGIVITNSMYCVLSSIPGLPPTTFLLCSLPRAITGGTGALLIACYCYIVDITDCRTRAFRLGVLQTSISLGSITGSLLTPLVYTKSSTYAFALASMFSIAGLLYTSLFLKETVAIKEGANTKLFNITLVKDMWLTVVKQRFEFLRSIIMLSSLVLTLNLMILYGESSLIYMYLQKQFSWTLENFTLFNAYATLLSACVPAVSLYVFSTRLQIPDMYLAIAATGLRIIEKVGLAYSEHTWQFYFVKIFGCFVLTTEPLIRSQLSKIFPSEDLGKIYAFISAVGGFGIFLCSPIYTTAYDMTIHNFANFIFFLSSIIGTFVLVLNLLILFLLLRSTKTEELLIEN